MMLEKGTRRPVLLTSRVDGPAAVGAAAVDRLNYPNDLVGACDLNILGFVLSGRHTFKFLADVRPR